MHKGFRKEEAFDDSVEYKVVALNIPMVNSKTYTVKTGWFSGDVSKQSWEYHKKFRQKVLAAYYEDFHTNT